MNDDENIIAVSAPNKKSTSEEIFDKYFAHTFSKKYTVSYLLISKDSENNLIDKLILQIQYALSELGDISFGIINNKYMFDVNIGSINLEVQINSKIYKNNDEILWEVKFTGDFRFLESFRTQFLVSINSLFIKKHCIYDEISDAICLVAYPQVRELENILREYLLRFFSNNLGSNWWKENANNQLESKIKSRSSRAFQGMLDMELYSIDFIDLTELLDAKSQMDTPDLLQALDNIVSVRENEEKFNVKIQKIKNKYLSNWKKFFEKDIKIENFLKTWKDLYDIRCEVAHNALINLDRFSKLVSLHNDIKFQLGKLIDDLRIIKTAENNLLNAILDFKITFSKNDIFCILNSQVLHITPQNFSEETMTIKEFKDRIQESKEELNLLGEFNSSEIQLNRDDEEFNENESINSISISIHYKFFAESAKGALNLGLNNNLFL